jgi:hypothetical protein
VKCLRSFEDDDLVSAHNHEQLIARFQSERLPFETLPLDRLL